LYVTIFHCLSFSFMDACSYFKGTFLKIILQEEIGIPGPCFSSISVTRTPVSL
jgi:hypothetical protein